MKTKLRPHQQAAVDMLKKQGTGVVFWPCTTFSPTGRLPDSDDRRFMPLIVAPLAMARDEPPSRFEANFADLEARLLASPEALVHALEGAYDLHKARAAQMYGVRYEDVTPDQREAGKQANMLDLYK